MPAKSCLSLAMTQIFAQLTTASRLLMVQLLALSFRLLATTATLASLNLAALQMEGATLTR
jgi:hypothetical protein